MKIFRFRAMSHSYGYIRANYFERLYLNARIAGGDTGIVSLEQLEKATRGFAIGPRNYKAQFIITAKSRHSRFQLHVNRIKEKSLMKPRPVKTRTFKIFGKVFEFRVRAILLNE